MSHFESIEWLKNSRQEAISPLMIDYSMNSLTVSGSILTNVFNFSLVGWTKVVTFGSGKLTLFSIFRHFIEEIMKVNSWIYNENNCADSLWSGQTLARINEDFYLNQNLLRGNHVTLQFISLLVSRCSWTPIISWHFPAAPGLTVPQWLPQFIIYSWLITASRQTP